MKHTMKRALALLIAVLLAMPSFAFAEEPMVNQAYPEETVSQPAPATEGEDLGADSVDPDEIVLDDVDQPVEEGGDADFAGSEELPEETAEDAFVADAPEEAAPAEEEIAADGETFGTAEDANLYNSDGTYWVRFENGIDPSNSSSYTQLLERDKPEQLYPNQFRRTGYTFNGWDRSDGTKHYDECQTVTNILVNTSDLEVVLYANWKPVEHTVNFNGNGATSGSMGAQTFKYAVPQTLSSNLFKRNNYTFAGWATSADGDVVYSDGQTLNITQTEPTGFTLYAVWETGDYIVHFDPNGGEGPERDQAFNVDVAQALRPNKYTREGYTFKGWNTAANGSGASFEDGQTVINLAAAGQEYKLYAQWTAKTYTVKYDGNGSDSGVMDDRILTYDQGAYLNNNGFTKEGHEFLGWSMDPDATQPSYTDAHYVTNLTSGDEVTLYAVWKANEYHMTFHWVVDNFAKDEVITQEYGTPVTPPTMDYPGYTFVGWRGAAAATAAIEDVPATMPAANIYQFWSDWRPNIYNVWFNPGEGATGRAQYETFVFDNIGTAVNTKLTPIATLGFKKTGYEFDHWVQSGSGATYLDQANILNLTTEDDGKIYFTAVWKPIQYTVAFRNVLIDPQNPNNTTAPTQLFTYDEEQALRKNTYAPEGQHFEGWAEKNGGAVKYADEQVVKNLASTSTEVNLYGVYDFNDYTVTFDANGGKGDMPDQYFTYGKGQQLNKNQFTRKGYTFIGWSANQGATVATYQDQQDVNNFTTEKGAVVTLYAVWSANTYVVKYDSNSTSLMVGSAVPDQDFTYDVSEKLNAVTFNRLGFTFSHWNTKPMGNGDSYEDGALVKNLTTEGVVTLYAIWRPIQYSVYFEANGGTGTMEPQTFAFNEVKPIRALGFEREGYTFENWLVEDHTNPNPVSPSYLNDGQNVTKPLAAIDGATVTATAIWKANKYTVKYLANDELAIGEVTGGVQNQTYTYDPADTSNPKNLQANGFTLKGYTFTGWNTQADGKGQHFEAGAAINFADTFHGDATLYAIWKLNEYQINYDLNDSPSVPAKLTGAPTSYNVSNQPFALVNPTRPGYVFLGWTGGNSVFKVTNPQVDVAVPKGTVSTLNFKANWQEVNMTVQFRANSEVATGTMADQEADYSDFGITTLIPNAFQNTLPYKFAGWTLDPDADPVTVDYGDKDSFAKIFRDYVQTYGAPEDNIIVTLYAVWSADTYFVINYIPNIPDMSDEINAVNQDAYKGTYTRLLMANDTTAAGVGDKFTRTGYTLLGWDYDPAAVDPIYAPGEKVLFTDAAPVRLYGIWGENKYNVSFLDDAGKVLNIEKMAFGVTPEFEAPEKAPDGQYTYVFAGWKCVAYNPAQVSSTTYNDSTNPTVAKDAVYNGTLPTVSGETAYQATYDAVPRTFSVTWVDHNDTIIKVKTPYLYGDHPTSDLKVGINSDAGDIPDYEDDFYTYHWNGSWADIYGVVYKTEAELPVVTEDTMYFAVYEKTPKKFAIVLLNDDEETRLAGTNQYDYDSLVTPPKPTSAFAAKDTAHTYAFQGWVNVQDETETVTFNVPKVTGDATYRAVYEVIPNIYQIDFVSDLGNYVLQTLYVPYGEIPEYTGAIPVLLMDPEVTVEGTDYIFEGWLDEAGKAYPDELPVVTGKATYKAHFASYAETFTVTWKDHAGVVVENDVNVAYGAKPEFSAIAKMVDYVAEDGSYTYKWAGWFSEADPDTIYTPGVDQLPPVTEDVMYDAYYTATPNDFTIRFVNYDNSAWSTREYPYGTKASDIVLPKDPERPQENDTVYTFVGWEPEIADVTGNATYRAVFEASDRLYTVVWTDDMDNVLETEKDYLAWDVPSYPNGVPEMAAQPADHKVYTFAGWKPGIKPIPGNDTSILDANEDGVIYYKATFRESDEKMIVVFKDYEGNIMDIQSVDYGKSAAEPTAPADYETEGATYSFEKWVPDIKNVTINNITCDVTFTAKMKATPKKYPIKLLNDDNKPLDGTDNYEYGTFPVPPMPKSAYAAAEAHFDYDFIGWLDADGTLLDFLPAVTGPATYKAVYLPTPKAYKITFKNDTVTLQESKWFYGDLPEYTGILPTKPAVNGTEYVFAGWTPAVTEVQKDAEYNATFTDDVQTFTHTFYNYDGTELWKVSGEYNSTYILAPDLLDAATKPEDDYYTYSFKEWQTSTPGAVIEAITGNASFIAVYKAKAKEYTITLLNDNGTQFKKIEQLHYGDQPVVTDLPQKAPEDGYTFVFDHWIDAEGNEYDILPVVTGNAAYKAVFEPTTKKFLIRFLDDDGTELQSAEYDYGDIPVYAGVTPTKNNPEAGKEYAFVGWLPAVTEVTKDQDYKPVFTDNLLTFTHRFYNYDGTLLYEIEGEYGDIYQDPAALVKPEKPQSSTTTYTFDQWVCLDTNAKLGTIESNASFVATYKEAKRVFTITLLNDDGSTFFERSDYEIGDQPLYDPAPTKTDPNGKFEYTFEGWMGVDGTFYAILPSVTGDAAYKAVFSKKLTSYIVTFQNEDGSVTLQTGKYLYGETPVFVGEVPTKESTNDEHYVFTGWTPAVVPVTGDAHYKATFTTETNYYVHSYYDYDGTLLHVFTGEFGTDYTEPAGPIREPDDEFTYEFTWWLPVVSGTSAGDMNGFASFVAQYEATPRTYTVTLINDDDTLVEKIGGLAYGAQPVATQVPTKTDPTGKYTYTFDKWIDRDGESHVMLPNVTGDATYKATYISKLNSYRIRFLDEDGTTVLQDNMEPYGSIPDYEGEEPTKPGAAGVEYVFERWTPAVTEVYGDRDYYATYTDETQVFTHEYFDYDGTLLYSISGEFGNTYAIPDGPTRESSDETTYTFKTWLPTMAIAEKGTFYRNAAFVATYTEAPRTYTITFVDYDDTVIGKMDYPYGAQPAPKTIPTRVDPQGKYVYAFDKWIDRDGEPHVILPLVTETATYKATYTRQLETFWVSFFNEDGSIKLQTGEYAYGEIPVYTGVEPIKLNPEVGKTYTFTGWTPAVEAVTGNADYKATFTDETDVYVHTYYDYDGTLLHVFTGEFGTDYTEPAGPIREPDDEFTYKFTGWLPVVSGTSAGDMNGFASFVAQYEATPRTYTVTLVDYDDTEIEIIDDLAYGEQPVPTAQPSRVSDEKYTYTFDKWIDRDGESYVILPNVTGDATYKATYTRKLNTYWVSFFNEDGSIKLQTNEYAYGDIPVYTGVEPVKVNPEDGKTYAFAGWTPAVVAVTGNADYKATFTDETDTYTHLYYDYDGTLLYAFTGEYNTTYMDPDGPVREPDDESTYTFDDWLPLVSDASVGLIMGNASFIATYTSDERMYTITFLYDDGTPYYSIDLPYGAQPAVNAPIKADTLDTTYDFDHWTNEEGDVFTIVPMVTGNATYEACFLPSEREYLVAFMDEGADIETITEVDPSTVPAGDLPKITIEANSNTVTIHSYRKDGKGTYTDTTITGKLLQIDWLPYGATPTYKGLAPVKEIGAGDEGKTFVFERWTPAISTVIGDTIYVATYASEDDVYVHNFYNYDGELITGIRGKLNETYDDPADPVPPVRPSDGEKNYTFDHWQPDTAGVTVGTIEGNANFTAVYTDQASGYTITYLNDDGTVFGEENLDYGEQPKPGIPTKQDSDEFSYVFDHWIDAEGNTYEILPIVTGDAVYKAVFEAVTRKYDVIFYDEDGKTILQTSEYEYGEVPSYEGMEPTKPEQDGVTYTFAGWTPAVVEVHGPQEYKAVYTPETEIYTHGFYNYDGELLYEISGKYDTDYADPAATINPTRPADERYSYTFDHWQPTVSSVQVGKILGNATFIAVYMPDIADYMITFVNDDDTLIEQQPYEYGDQPIAPKAVKSDTFEHTYRFLHWVDRDGTAWTILPKVTGDATYKAVYEEQDRVYLVAFMGEDATIVTETAMQPSAASNDMQARVEADMGSATIYTIRDDGTGTFTESTFTGTLLQYQWMPFGSIPEYMGNDPVPVNPDDGYTYTFTGWTPVLSPVSGDIVYVATFDKQLTEYTITWVDGDGFTLEETYYYGETPTFKGPIPTKTSSDSEVYTFTGWAPEIEAVWRDRTYVAQFDAEPRLYTVTFVDENGFDLEDTPKQYPYGTPAGAIELPTNIPTKMADATGTYTFAGWTPLITTVTGDAVYKATYRRTEQTYLIAFMNDDAVYNIRKTVIPVDSAETPETRIETDLNDVTTVTTYRNDGNGTLYETTYVGTLLQVDWMKYGVMPKYTGIDPVSTDVTGKYTSEFVGWAPAIVPVYGDAVYVAAYNRTENTYNVTWLDGDHNELYTENVPYGTHPVYNGPEPTKTPIGGYTYEFTGNWTPEITDQTIVNRDMTFIAVFDSVRRKYSIKFVDEDGTTVLKEAEQYYYGTPAKDIIKPDDPTKEPDGVFTYKFTGWEPLVADVTCDMVYRATYNNNFRKYTITWIVDGVVSTEQVPYGMIPTYQMGATPKKATDDYYDYFFIGWDRMIVPVTKDATYEAQFAKFPRLYTIVWDTGDVVTSEKHGYGTLIKWPENPTRPGYEFVGWDPEVPNYMPAWDLRFTAIWREVDNYLVRFVNWDDSLLQASLMKYLEIPVYKGGTPTRPDDEFYTYTFIGWTPIISEILGETTFKAQYKATLRPEFLPDDDDHGGVLASGLIAVMKAAGSKKLKINWTRVNGVSGYDIYFNRCNSDGEIRYVKLIATVPAGRNTYTVTGLTKQICYKTVVRAFRIIDGKKVYVAKSPMAHAICGGSNKRYTNPKSLKVKPKNVTLNLVGHKKIKPTLKGLRDSKIVLDQGHAPRVRYYTSNPAVAVVNGKGVISAVGRGNCKVYALAANGIYKIINVRVR